jgi:hypothetical protein
MFVSDKIVYLQMPKAGSTHVTNILKKHCGGRAERVHSPLKDQSRYSSRIIASSVRDPWDWYVSQWAFACTRHGRLRDYFENLPRSEFRQALKHRDFASMLRFPIRTLAGRPDWKRLCSDPANDANFREWLRLVLGSEGVHIGLEGYASSPIKAVVGFMTYRFLALTTEYTEWTRAGRKCRSYDEIASFADKHTIVTQVLRVETLNEDLLGLLKTAGLEVSPADAVQWGKHNTSVRREYSDYYDEETSLLVERRERFIIERFGYRPIRRASAGNSFAVS